MYKYFALLAVLISISACKKETVNNDKQATAVNGNLSILVKNMIGNEDLMLSDMRYTNSAGNLYSISMLKYYISNVSLHKKGGNNTSITLYKLIDAANLSSCQLNLGNLEAGDYDSMSFYIGIDPSHNHTGAQDGDLDVSKGMFWTWNTGYIFFKHEGQYKNSAMQNKSLVLHLGTDNAFSKVVLPINLSINGDKTMEIKLDLNSVYSSPINIDFNIDNNRQSSSAADDTWIGNMNSNFGDAFSFIKVQ